MKIKAVEQRNGHAAQGKSKKRDARGDQKSTTSSVNNVSLGTRKTAPPKRTTLLKFTPRPDWHSAVSYEPANAVTSAEAPPKDLLQSVHQHALSLLKAENEAYASSNFSSDQSHKFLSTIMSSGTLSDKISALTLAIQESPLHNMKAFESLMALAKKRSRGQAVTALGALKDLLGQGVVLPADRKLRAFGHQPALLAMTQQLQGSSWKLGDELPSDITDERLLSWAYEDWLKTQFFEMLKLLEVWCNDEVEFARLRALQYVWELLKEKPEQEANLLRLLVNKLGDPDKKIASKASFLLLQLEITHPFMKPVIISAIETELLFRPGQSSHAQYYALITLNQTAFSTKEEDVAAKLLDIYFNLFVVLLKKKPKAAIPATGENKVALNRRGQVQGGGGKPGKKAKTKLEKESNQKGSEEELTERLISAILTGINRAYPFTDSDSSSFEDHIDTLFRVTHSANLNTSIQALQLIQQLSTRKQLISDRFYRTLYESLLDPRLLTSSKQAMYLNLLFRSLRDDLNVKRVKAFVKRLVQIITLHQPPFVCGVLYLIYQLEGTFASLHGLINQPPVLPNEDEEIFRDVPDLVEGERSIRTVPETSPTELPSKNTTYDPHKRDPAHANASQTCLWELHPLIHHYHPSVSLFATRLLSGQEMPPKPDLSLHTLIHFLDRFAYRNAKAATAQRGSSIMQPLAGEESNKGAAFLSTRNSSKAQAPLNSKKFWQQKAEDVAVDDVFFHQYFGHVRKDRPKEKKQDKKGRKDGDGEESDAGENEIWTSLVKSRPEIEGGSDDDDDDDIDLDSMSTDADEQGSEEDGGEDAEDDAFDSEEDLGEESGSESGGVIFNDFDAEDEDGERVFASDDEGDVAATQKAEGEPSRPLSERQKKRRKLRGLPTFASADDYAEMLAEDDEDEGQ